MPSAAPSVADRAVTDPASAAASGQRIRSSSAPSRARPHAFPREARLLSGRAYDAVFADNRRLADRYWTVLVHTVPRAADADPVPAARLGLAIAKKRARRAVDRNRIKRVARESFRHARDALAGHHVVVMNRDAAASAGARELRAALDALWARLGRRSRGGAPRR